ncbi:MAG TPA: cupin domain-containing protein [Steroidobacteraceae bacterium]|nr:cupin domain-containing protein [Steroidobacteraceae bacterium]
MKRILINSVPARRGTGYPAPFDQPCIDRVRQPIARSQGITRFGVNLTVIPPGGWTSQRHWHSHEDEFVWILEGELTLISNDGEETLRAGDCVAFIAGDPDGHHLVNRSAHPAKLLEIGNADTQDRCVYPDIDLLIEAGGPGFTHRDGSPYPPKAS